MKRILPWLFVFSVSLAALRGQDAGMQQQIDQLRGSIQDVQDAQALLAKRLDALEKEIRDLRDKSSGANQDDLQKLADQVQEIDKKRQEDRTLILKELEKLGKVGGGSPTGRKPPVVSTTTTENPGSPGTGPQKGYEYTIQRGDTLLAIAKAYREQGIKVTTDQILKANPGLNANNLKAGQKIFIPAPAQ
jgi:nucleoid-associated protein YgaU